MVAGVSPRHTLCRHAPEWWPDMARNAGPACSGISGRHRPECAANCSEADARHRQVAGQKRTSLGPRFQKAASPADPPIVDNRREMLKCRNAGVTLPN